MMGVEGKAAFLYRKISASYVEWTIEFRQWMLKTTGWKVTGEYGGYLHSDKEYWNYAKVSLTFQITY